jgi:hypothetical protein
MSDIKAPEIDTAALQFETIFRNKFGVLPADIGLVTTGYSAAGNGHTVALSVVAGKIIGGWEVDGQILAEHRLIGPKTHQDGNLAQLRAALNLS